VETGLEGSGNRRLIKDSEVVQMRENGNPYSRHFVKDIGQNLEKSGAYEESTHLSLLPIFWAHRSHNCPAKDRCPSSSKHKSTSWKDRESA
jgi:hypothetical protein